MNGSSYATDSDNLPRPSRRRFVQASTAVVAALAAGRGLGGAEPATVSRTATNAGRRWPSELTIRKDPVSGATVRQLRHVVGESIRPVRRWSVKM